MCEILRFDEYFKYLNKIDSNNETTSREEQIVKDFNIWAIQTNETPDRPISLEEVCKCANGSLSYEKILHPVIMIIIMFWY